MENSLLLTVSKCRTLMSTITWIHLWHSLLIITLFVSLTSPVQAAPERPRAYAALLAMAQAQPDKLVTVIVQKYAQATLTQQTLTGFGATITKDLSFINAFAAELPAGAVPLLASHAAVRWVSLDAPVVKSGGPDGVVSRTALLNSYIQTTQVHRLWDEGYQGSSVTVAIVDSGIAGSNDFKADYGGNGDMRVLTTETVVGGADKEKDWFGHGTHVAGIVAGNGTLADGRYIGVAPKAKLVAVDVANQDGAASISDVIVGLQWIYNNKNRYNIRVVNLSLNSSVAESYHTSALNAACEILWFNGIVVVASAGNNGSGADKGILYPPANDPFVITVGAADDRGTPNRSDDRLASFSAYGLTTDGFFKPEIVAPGKDIISVLSKQDNTLRETHPGNSVYTFSGSEDLYFRMSGTSMAAPIVAGVVALLLQDEPNLTPDQVKARLMLTAQPTFFQGPVPFLYLNAYAAVHRPTTLSANVGIPASQLLWSGSQPVAWNSVSWNSVSWNSVSWNSVSWNSVSWNSVSWNSDYWADTVDAASAPSTVILADPQNVAAAIAFVEKITAMEQTAAQRLFLPLVNR